MWFSIFKQCYDVKPVVCIGVFLLLNRFAVFKSCHDLKSAILIQVFFLFTQYAFAIRPDNFHAAVPVKIMQTLLGKAFGVKKGLSFDLTISVIICAPFKRFIIPVRLPDIYFAVAVRILGGTGKLSLFKIINAVKLTVC